MEHDKLRDLWNKFGNVPIDENDNIDEDFVCGDITFEKGTDRLEVWHWFDEQFSNGLYIEIFE